MINGKISTLRNKNGDVSFPVTSSQAVYMKDGTTVEKKIEEVGSELDANTKNILGIKNIIMYKSLNEAFNDLEGSKMIIPPGKYTIDSDLIINANNFELEGMGKVEFLFTKEGSKMYIKGDKFNIYNVDFVGLGELSNQITCVRTYRSEFHNCRFIGFSNNYISCVYAYYNKVFFNKNGKSLTPINLIDKNNNSLTSDVSTMIELNKTVFFDNNIGLEIGDTQSSSKPPIRMSLIRCGFEHNSIGINQNATCLLLTIDDCWFEMNKTYHANLLNYGFTLKNIRINENREKFNIRPYDEATLSSGQGGYTEIKQNILSTNTIELQNIVGQKATKYGIGTLKIDSVTKANGSYIQVPNLNYKYTDIDNTVFNTFLSYSCTKEYNAQGFLFISPSCEVKKQNFYTDITVTKISTGVYEISWGEDKFIRYPIVNINSFHSNNKNIHLSNTFSLTDTRSDSNFSQYGMVNKIIVKVKNGETLIDGFISVNINYTIEK